MLAAVDVKGGGKQTQFYASAPQPTGTARLPLRHGWSSLSACVCRAPGWWRQFPVKWTQKV